MEGDVDLVLRMLYDFLIFDNLSLGSFLYSTFSNTVQFKVHFPNSTGADHQFGNPNASSSSELGMDRPLSSVSDRHDFASSLMTESS